MVPPSGVKAQLIMAAASSGQLAQPSIMQHVHSPYMQTTQVQTYNMIPNLMGGVGPGTVSNMQPPQMYQTGQMAQMDAGRMGGAQLGGLDAVADGMSRMGFYGNQLAMPRTQPPNIEPALSSGFYQSRSPGKSTSRRPQGGSWRSRSEGRSDGRPDGQNGPKRP